MAKVPFKEFFTRRYLKSLVFGYLKKEVFKDIKIFCMFVGYQRSGHSFIGALLDAHPNAVIGMEVDALDLIQKGYSRNQIFYCLMRNAEIFTKKLGNIWTGYDYSIPGQYQGTYKRIDVIGDKKGGKSSLRLNDDPGLLEKLKKVTGLQLKILHVIRHPVDNITTMVVRNVPEGKSPDRSFILERSEIYFTKALINDKLRQNEELDILDIYHEDFVKSPRDELIRILEFLELEPFPDYLDACVKKVFKEPHLSRYDMDWPEDLLNEIREKAVKYPFLKRYFK
jgi:hypothetical protein